MNYRLIFFLLLGIDIFILLFQTTELSISAKEAFFLQESSSLLSRVVNTSLHYFGNNDFALRLPMILLHILSVVLLYEIAKEYLNERNRLWLSLVYMMLPGVVSASLIISSASIVIFGLLLFVYCYQKKYIFIYMPLLLVYALVSSGFMYLFLALMFYTAYKKEKLFFTYVTLLFFISMYLFGINARGTPSGHFLDSIGVYSAIFTPIIFIYTVYVLYRKLLTKDVELLWFISTTALVLSLVLSFRQRIEVAHFAPYLLVAFPVVAKTFYSSYRVRLRMFRKNYRTIFILSFAFLLLNTTLIFFNKYLYLVLKNPEKHFAYDMHIAKDVAKELKSQEITCVTTNKKMQARLAFYGISKCNDFRLVESSKNNLMPINVTISYKNRGVYFANVTKVNN
jgi:hypothetical protein